MSTAVRYDPYAYATHEDPYPVYRRLRDDAPAYLDEDRGFWALSRHDDVRAALDDVATFSSTGGITLERGTGALEPMLIEMDPPRHTELRALVSRAFTPRRVAELEGPVRAISRELIARFDPERVDGIGDFAARLPMAVISAMLGVPPDDQDQLREWSDAMLHREEGSTVLTNEGIEGAAHLYGYIDRLVAARHSSRGTDLVSALVALQVDEGALSHQEVLGFCFLLIIAGNETTTKLLGNALYWLGECLYAQKLYLEALQTFQRVIRDYPDGNKVPDAMLKTGLCYQNLGEPTQARKVLLQVAEIYPGSGAAGIALERARALR